MNSKDIAVNYEWINRMRLLGHTHWFVLEKFTSHHMLDMTVFFHQARLDAALHVVGSAFSMVLSGYLISFVMFSFQCLSCAWNVMEQLFFKVGAQKQMRRG